MQLYQVYRDGKFWVAESYASPFFHFKADTQAEVIAIAERALKFWRSSYSVL